MAKLETILSHDILCDTKDRSDHDHQTCTIEHEEVTLPWNNQLFRTDARYCVQAIVEDSSNDDEGTVGEHLDT